MPQWMRANLLLVLLIAISAGALYLSHAIARAVGLLPDETRYFTAAVGVVVLIGNYLIARRVHKALARIEIDAE